jgi:hypothetical protein
MPRDVGDDYWQQVKWLSMFVDAHASRRPVNRVFLGLITNYRRTATDTAVGTEAGVAASNPFAE